MEKNSNSVLFKIEVGKFLGIKDNLVGELYAVKHSDGKVKYLSMDDIHATEDSAYKALIKMLKKKVT